MKTESTKRNAQFWKNVMIGGVPGILIGALGTGLATSASATTPEEPVVGTDTPVLEPLPIAEVSDEMSFGQAFAAARAQVGPGGMFEWRGNVYNTYNAEEWGSMTSEDREEFADRISVTPIEIEVGHVAESEVTGTEASEPIQAQTETETEPQTETETETAETETNTQEVAVHPEDGPVIPEEEVVGEIDVQIEEVGVVVAEDGSEVVMATGQIDGHATLLADLDNDGVIDAMAVDVNDNDYIDDNELASMDDVNLTVEDVVMLADNNSALDPTDDIYSGTPDYINDADTSAFA